MSEPPYIPRGCPIVVDQVCSRPQYTLGVETAWCSFSLYIFFYRVAISDANSHTFGCQFNLETYAYFFKGSKAIPMCLFLLHCTIIFVRKDMMDKSRSASNSAMWRNFDCLRVSARPADNPDGLVPFSSYFIVFNLFFVVEINKCFLFLFE